MPKKILLLAGDYVEDYEIMVPFQMLLMVGHQVHAICPGKKEGETVATAIHDFEGDQTYSEKRGHNFRLNADFDQVRREQYDGLVIPGGRAPEYLRHDETLLDIVRKMHAAGQWVFSICHGIQVLAAAGILNGRRVTCYEHVRFEVKTVGGEWDKRQAVRDGNLVTAQTWESHPEFYREVFRCLREAK